MTPVDQQSLQLMPYDHDASQSLSYAEKHYAVIERYCTSMSLGV